MRKKLPILLPYKALYLENDHLSGVRRLLGQAMHNLLHCLRLSWVALVAIAGTLWIAPEVLACATDRSATTACCCSSQTSTGSDCCSTKSDRPATSPPASDGARGTRVTGTRVPGSTCACGQPALPAHQSGRRETRTNEERGPGASFGSLYLYHSALPKLPPRSFAPSEPVHSTIPLYLRHRSSDHLNRESLRDRQSWHRTARVRPDRTRVDRTKADTTIPSPVT